MSYSKPFPKFEYEQRVNKVKQLQSGMWLDDFGAAVSEPFVVTDQGDERLSHVARKLIVIE